MLNMKSPIRGNRRQFISSLACVAAGQALSSKLGGLDKVVLAGERTLRDLAAQKGLLYGCATTQDHLAADAEFGNVVARECGLLVPENAVNWKYVEPQPGAFDYHLGDWMLNFAEAHNMKFGGGTLVWHESLPGWINNSAGRGGIDVVRNHVSKIVGHYRGRAFSWAVVNETTAFREAGTVLKDTPLLRLAGPEYIEQAFLAAAEADPGALLVYNENHLEYDEAEADHRRTILLDLLKRLVAKKIPVGALGIQSHLRTGNVPFSAGKLGDFLSRVSDLGLKLVISELDVTEKGSEAELQDRDHAIAREIDRYLGVVLQQKSVVAVVTWGLSARYSWLNNYAPRSDGQKLRPLPYDADLRPTEAWQALANAFERAPSR